MTKCPKCGKVLYKYIGADRVDKILSAGEVTQWGFISFTTESNLKWQFNQFGSARIVIDVDKVKARGYKVVPVHYDYDWLWERPAILVQMTGMLPNQWEDWCKERYGKVIPHLITQRIQDCYMWEKEVIVADKDDDFKMTGMKPVTLYKDDIKVLNGLSR